MAPDEILDRLHALVPELEAEGNALLAVSVREVIALLEAEPQDPRADERLHSLDA